jgi:putative SOS response-associated peptidase YedK
MCARFSLVAPVAQVEAFLGLDLPDDLPMSPNVAPTMQVPAAVQDAEGRRLKMLRWGLVPSWADDVKVGVKMINARCETAADKPAFRDAYRKRRCVIPANGFYEWRDEESDEQLGLFEESILKTRKQPYLFSLKDSPVLGLAGLWERWKKPDGEWLETCSILTTEPNDLMAEFHDRMPCILQREDVDLWLDPDAKDLTPLLAPIPAAAMRFESVEPATLRLTR